MSEFWAWGWYYQHQHRNFVRNSELTMLTWIFTIWWHPHGFSRDSQNSFWTVCWNQNSTRNSYDGGFQKVNLFNIWRKFRSEVAKKKYISVDTQIIPPLFPDGLKQGGEIINMSDRPINSLYTKIVRSLRAIGLKQGGKFVYQLIVGHRGWDRGLFAFPFCLRRFLNSLGDV